MRAINNFINTIINIDFHTTKNLKISMKPWKRRDLPLAGSLILSVKDPYRYRYVPVPHLINSNQGCGSGCGSGSGSGSRSGSAWIRIHFHSWIRIWIRIQYADPDPGG